MIKIGPSGIGGINEAKENLKKFKENNLEAAEIAFTYSIYLNKENALEIGAFAKKLGIDLSIHAPYYINLNSDDLKKVENSKNRIIKCCEIGHYLQAKYIVFHPGYYGKMNRDDSYEKIKNEIINLQKIIKENKWNVKLAPETMGKINVFGSFEETLKLVNEAKTSFCLDFAHLKARNIGKIDFKDVISKLKEFEHVHCHYSGIEYTDKGEKNHIPVDFNEYEIIIKELKKQNINCTIICESPDPFNDSIKMRNLIN